MEWKIVADSSCDLLPEEYPVPQGIGFETVPLKIRVGDNEYVDNAEVDLRKMYQDMATSKAGASSACPSPDEWAHSFEAAKNVIGVTISRSLSGSYNSALVGRDLVKEAYPEKNIYIQDSFSTSGAMILIVEKAMELIASALPFEEITRLLGEFQTTVQTLFTLSNYDNLVKNGRMSKFTGMIASSLGLRAVATATEEGSIKVLHKARGEGGAIKYIVDLMGKMKEIGGKHVVISHCNNMEGAELLKSSIEAVYAPEKVSILPTRALTSFYADQQGLIICF